MRFFPLWPATNGACTCSLGPACTRVGKHPRVKGWIDTPEGPPIAPAGIAMGRGVFALDLDLKDGKDGFAALAKLAAGRPLPPSWSQRTPTGGAHVVYTYDPAVWSIRCAVDLRADVLGKGLDIRGTGGFIVGPGTVHRNGGAYTLVSDALAPAPEWLLRELHSVAPARESGNDLPPGLEEDDPEFERAVRGFAADLARSKPAIKGDGGDTTIWNHALRGVRGWGLRPDTAAAVIRNSPARGDRGDAEIDRKCESAQHTGATFEPRQLLHEAITLEGLAALAKPGTSGSNAVPYMPPENVPAPVAFRVDTAVIEDPKACCTWLAPNVATWFARTFPGRVTWDGFTGRVHFEGVAGVFHGTDCSRGRGFTRDDAGIVQAYLQTKAGGASSGPVRASRDAIVDGVRAVAKQNETDSLRDWLESLDTRGITEADALAEVHAFAVYGWGASPRDGMAQLFAERWIVGATKRGLGSTRNTAEGCAPVRFDLVPVLVGPLGGEGKSSMLRTLAGYLNGQSLALQSLPALEKEYECTRMMRGTWLGEIGELVTLLRHPELFRDFVTRTSDKNRRMQADDTEDVERRTVFLGSTNATDGFLRRGESNRRVCPVHVVQPIDVAEVERKRERLWACGRVLAAAGVRQWLSPAEREALRGHCAAFEAPDDIEEALVGWLTTRPAGDIRSGELRAQLEAQLPGVRIPQGSAWAALLRRAGIEKRKSNGFAVCWWKGPPPAHE